VAKVKLVIFSHHSPLGVAIGVGQLGYDIDAIVKTLDTGEVIDFREPLLSALIIDSRWTVKPTFCSRRKYSVRWPSVGPVAC